MALINCKECGKEISTMAEVCPHCGSRTQHGKSIAEKKSLLTKYAIWGIFIVFGVVLLFGSFKPFAELLDEWENVKWWYDHCGNSFMEFVVHEREGIILLKLVAGIGLIIVGAISMCRIKGKADSIKGNGFDLELSETGDDE